MAGLVKSKYHKMKNPLKHVVAFAALFSVLPNRRKNDQWQIDPDTSLETIAAYYDEQQARETTDKEHVPLEGMECIRQDILKYLNSKVQEVPTVDEKDKKGNLVARLDVLVKRVNGWYKPAAQSVSVADLKDKCAVLQALADAYDAKEEAADGEELKAADELIAELKAKAAKM